MKLLKSGLKYGLAALGLMGSAQALELPAVFSDNMVLQRGQKVRVWGTSDSDVVAVKFNDQVVKGKVVDGKWELLLAPMRANTNPQTLWIKDRENTIEIDNVLIGDVFFCSGQSNMEMPATHSNDCKELVANSANDQIRICSSIQVMSDKPLDDFANGVSGWHEAGPEALATSGVLKKRGFSGTAYSFAYHLQKRTKVPVGVFVSAWGGVPIHAYADTEMIANYPSKVSGTGKRAPSSLYNGLVHPLVKFNIAGWLWYQGEDDVKVKDYDQRMILMIERWRKLWGDEKKPFYFVQICPFTYKGAKIEDFWKQQLAVAKRMDNVFIAKTEDIGNLKDIHPHNKLEVGKRLAELVK